MEETSIFSVDKKSQTKERDLHAKVRCPECLKLYLIDPTEFKSKTPKFECIKCEKKFWIYWDEHLGYEEKLGFPIELLERKSNLNKESESTKQTIEFELKEKNLDFVEQEQPELDLRSEKKLCLKCGQILNPGLKECPKCLIILNRSTVLDKVKQEKEMGFSASKSLLALWQSVLNNYEDEAFHQKFLKACQNERNLVFASRQYGRILSLSGGQEEIALKMKNQVVALIETMHSSSVSTDKPKNKVTKSWFNLSNFFLFFSGVLIVTGYFVPPLRNMVGFGAALIFLTIALRRSL